VRICRRVALCSYNAAESENALTLLCTSKTMHYDIIGDIHAHAKDLKHLLKQLGYTPAATHPQNRRLLFLGDYIDRGPYNYQTILLIRRLVKKKRALALMGNHDLNAVLFYTRSAYTGSWIRPHTQKNRTQHATLLKEIRSYRKRKQVVRFLRSCPLFYQDGKSRFVHACWDDAAVALITEQLGGSKLSAADVQRFTDNQAPFTRAVYTLLKGKTTDVGLSQKVYDQDGTQRKQLRIAWWLAQPKSWQELIVAAPSVKQMLPNTPLPDSLQTGYPPTAPPVIFGHYSQSTAEQKRSANALCLDYAITQNGVIACLRQGTEYIDGTRIRGQLLTSA